MLTKFKKHLNKLFLFCPRSQNMVELKEELLGMLMDKSEELSQSGMSDEEVFNECVSGLDEYKQTIKELEKQTRTKATLFAQIKLVLLSLAVYFLGLTIIFLSISFATDKWHPSWMVYIVGVIIFAFAVFIVLLKYGKGKSSYYIARIGILGITVAITTALYLALSFLSGLWEVSWVIFVLGFVIWYVIDLLYRMRNKVSLFSNVDAGVIIAMCAAVIYFSVSISISGAWSWSWLILLGSLFIFLCFVLGGKIMSYFKREGIKQNINIVTADKEIEISIERNVSGEEEEHK